MNAQTTAAIFNMPPDELTRRIKDDDLLLSSLERWLERERHIVELVRVGQIDEEIQRQQNRIDELRRSKLLKETILMSKELGIAK